MKSVKLWLMYGAFVLMILINALANILPINGYETGEISNRYLVYFTPAGYVFSIWGIIYLLLLLWLISFSLRKQALSNSQYKFFLLSCLFNAGWIFAWHYLLDGLSLILIICLLISLLLLYRIQRSKNQAIVYLIPVSVYLGWIILAALTNFSYWLTASIGISDTIQLWITYLLLLITAAAAFIIIRFFKDWAMTAVFVWAMVGIVVKNLSSENTIAIFAIVALFFVVLYALVHLFKNRQKS